MDVHQKAKNLSLSRHTDGPTDGHALMESLRRDLKTVGSLVFMKASVKKQVLRGLLREDSYFNSWL